MRKLLSVAVCAAMLSVLLTAPVSAGKPVKSDSDFATEYSLGDPNRHDSLVLEPFDCDFRVKVGLKMHQSWERWYDESGDLVRAHFQLNGERYFYPNADPSIRLSGRFSVSGTRRNYLRFPEVPGEYYWDETANGTFWDLRTPDGRKVYRQSGRVTMRVYYDRGDYYLHDQQFVGRFRFDPEAICEALDPR